MPTINLNNKRKYQPMTNNNKALHVWYNCARWRRLRKAKLRVNPLCELCLAKNIVRATEEVHHIKPIDINNPDEEMIYDWGNLESLCKECHHIVHTTDRRIKHIAR